MNKNLKLDVYKTLALLHLEEFQYDFGTQKTLFYLFSIGLTVDEIESINYFTKDEIQEAYDSDEKDLW